MKQLVLNAGMWHQLQYGVGGAANTGGKLCCLLKAVFVLCAFSVTRFNTLNAFSGCRYIMTDDILWGLINGYHA